MSDAELAYTFSGLCIKALNTDPADTNAPIWREFSAILPRPRLIELAGVAGVSLLPANWQRGTSAEQARAIETLCDAVGTMREYFYRLERTDPQRHARDSLRRTLAEIPFLRDEGRRGFLHRVTSQFYPAGAEDELRPHFESVAELAGVLGVERPRGWRPNPMPDWAGWCDEWARLADFCRSLIASPELNSEPPPTPVVNTREGEVSQPVSDRKQTPTPEPARTETAVPLASLLAAASEADLIGKEAKVVRIIAEKGGKVSIPDAETLCNGDAVSAFKRAKKKMRKLGWNLYQRDNHLRAELLPQKGRN